MDWVFSERQMASRRQVASTYFPQTDRMAQRCAGTGPDEVVGAYLHGPFATYLRTMFG